MNKKEMLYEALTDVKREYLDEAERFSFKKRRFSPSRLIGMAAAACLLIALAAIVMRPKRERPHWALTDTTVEPTNSCVMPTSEPPRGEAELRFTDSVLLAEIPMVDAASLSANTPEEGTFTEGIGYLRDPSGIIGPTGLAAMDNGKVIILDQVQKQLITVTLNDNGRADMEYRPLMYDSLSFPRDMAYLDAVSVLEYAFDTEALFGGDGNSEYEINLGNLYEVDGDGTLSEVPDGILSRFVDGGGLIAVLDADSINILRLPDAEHICTVSLPEEYHESGYCSFPIRRLRFADGKLYFNANSQKALAIGVAALFENEHIGAEMLEEVPAMPQISDATDYTVPGTEAPDGMTVSYEWFRKYRVSGWGRNWVVGGDSEDTLITPIDAYENLLLAQTDIGTSINDIKSSVGLYSSETDASCSMVIHNETRMLPAQFAMSPTGRVYMIEFCENNAHIYELEYAWVIDVTDDSDVPQLLEPGAENLLYFTDLEELKAFLASPELSDEEFEQFVSEKLDPAMGIVTKEDARAVIGRIEQIPFPMTADLEPSGFEFYFYNKSEENYPYSIAYSMPDGGVCSFSGQLEGEYSLAKDIEAYASHASPVDFEGNAFVNRLYYESFGDVHAFYADIGGRIVNAQFWNLTYDEALEALCFFSFCWISGTGEQTPSELAFDPWYLEKAWEYADFANREYGFNFIKDEAQFSDSDGLTYVYFTHREIGDYINPQEIWIYFDKTAKAVEHVQIFGDGSDKPAEYASMSDEKLNAMYEQMNSCTVTREDLLQAGYTLDGTDEDYLKLAEYCANLKVAELENAPELHCYRCIDVDFYMEADLGNVLRYIEYDVTDGTETIDCNLTYYFRPAYPKLFIHSISNRGVVCEMSLLDDAEHPGWICIGGSVNTRDAADDWSCWLGYDVG